ncbi:MAG: hypothetical protein KDA21_03200 [Phycisphaerales bacterium]|nr:hypothetical protein [Phycisphaerales bacterium]
MPRRRPTPQALITFASAACLTMVLLPSRYTGWLSVFRDPVLALVAPVSGPATAVASMARSGEDRRPRLEPEDLSEQRDFYRAEYERALQRIGALESQVTALQSGVAPLQDPGTLLLDAPRIGADLAGGWILVRQGRRAGVVPDQTVATAGQAPQHLVGIVTEARVAVSTVLLANDPRVRVGQHKLIGALVLPEGMVTSDTFATAPRCDLAAAGDGTYVSEEIDAGAGVSVGDIVHLSDDNWPESAQMLVLGHVTEVVPQENPLWVTVVVEPDFDLSRVRHLVLRTSRYAGEVDEGDDEGDGS